MRALLLIYQRLCTGQEACGRIKEAVRLVFSEEYLGAGCGLEIGQRNRIHRLESAGKETGTGGQYTLFGVHTSDAGSPSLDGKRVSRRRLGLSKNHQGMETSRALKATSATVPKISPRAIGPSGGWLEAIGLNKEKCRRQGMPSEPEYWTAAGACMLP